MTEAVAAQENTEAAPKVETPVEQKSVETPKVETPKAEVKPETKPEPAKEPEVKAPVVPEKYDLKLPEGSPLDASQVEAVSSYAKEQKLSQETAQAILDRESKANEVLVRQNTKVWLEELRNDKEFGGNELEANGELAFKAAEKWFGNEFAALIKKAHLNNHPMLFKGLVRLGKANADDTFVKANSIGGIEKSEAELFYGTTNNKE